MTEALKLLDKYICYKIVIVDNQRADKILDEFWSMEDGEIFEAFAERIPLFNISKYLEEAHDAAEWAADVFLKLQGSHSTLAEYAQRARSLQQELRRLHEQVDAEAEQTREALGIPSFYEHGLRCYGVDPALARQAADAALR